ncbi:MAG: response regulator [Campylobacterales bacterium]|nr:response regulator [Campylobacterales bacterium]
MKSFTEIMGLTKKYNVLYVEDEKSIRTNMVDFFEKIFNQVFVAVDGLDGLEKFHKNRIDFIISDIQMPNMSGLEMVKIIREHSSDIPIVITTAFNEQDFFIKSIDLKVDKYILKPMNLEHVRDVLYDISKLLFDRARAKELEILQIKEKINRISDQLIMKIADGFPNPCIILNGEDVRYINDAFCNLFQENEFEQFLQKKININNLFSKREGFMDSLKDYNEKNKIKNRVTIEGKKGRKIYSVIQREIDVSIDSSLSQMYTFNDITWEEYQKIKIKNYSELLEEIIFSNRYRISPKKKVVSEEKSLKLTAPSATSKMKISDQENALLRRSHLYKTSAGEYVKELDDEILNELQELDQLGKEFKYSAKVFQDDKNIAVIDEIVIYLSKYAHVINLLFEFEDLSYAVRSLSELLSSIKEKELRDKDIKKISLFLGAIESDLADWYQLIFIEKSAQDIHYLDSSLFSACLQIELILSSDINEMESEENDLELF